MSIPVIALCIYSLVSTVWVIWTDARLRKKDELFDLYKQMTDEIIDRLRNGEESL